MSNGFKNADSKEKPLLLFSCLDWGLGHTTRSMPLIREFLDSGCILIVACNSTQKKILETEFPSITYVDLPGYDIQYSSSKWRTRLEIVFQIRKILTKIKTENRWLTAFLKQNPVSAIISDNRYGFYQPEKPCILITHQLSVNTSGGRVADKISRRFLYSLISRFSECWVPDFEKKPFLAGKLSHPAQFPRTHVKYIGALSRFEMLNNEQRFQNQVAIILSGPEPQRTLLEEIILTQAAQSNKTIVFVRGLPDGGSQLQTPENVIVYNHLPLSEMNELICNSEYIVCRSGYTSIMDLTKLKKKMILIPTPGQPEQEYLASWMMQEQLAISVEQNKFSLDVAIDTAAAFAFKHVDQNMDQYKEVVRTFVSTLSS